MSKLLRKRKEPRSTPEDSLSLLPETNNLILETKKKDYVQQYFRISHVFYMLLLTLAVIWSWKKILFSRSNFIALGHVDFSPLRILYGPLSNKLWVCSSTSFYWNDVDLQQQSHHHLHDCTFDLRKPLAIGGESWVYEGICNSEDHNNQTTTDTSASSLPVLLKSMKQRWGSKLEQEIQASKIMSQSGRLQLYNYGWNFLLVTNLVGYGRLTLHRNPELLLQALEEYWNQLKKMHSHGMLHLDVWLPNLLYHRDSNKLHNKNLTNKHTNANQFQFQLIDFSSARHISEPNLLREKLFSKEWHLPKFPILACQLPEHENTAYCINQTNVEKLCLGFLDGYPLAVRILRNLIHGVEWTTVPYNSFPPTLDDLVHRHEEDLRRLQTASNKFQNDPIIPLIASFMDPLQLNMTRVCGGAD